MREGFIKINNKNIWYSAYGEIIAKCLYWSFTAAGIPQYASGC
jgi:hypothetical protein